MKALTFALVALLACAVSAKDAALTPVPMPGGGEGIGFDDLGYASGLKKILVPGGRTGKLFLVDPVTRKIKAFGGFSKRGGFKGGHGEGITSADEGAGLLFGTDRNTESVSSIDSKTGQVVGTVKLGGHPDYVRYVAPTREVWVSEPNSEKIEVFSLSTNGKMGLEAAIPVPGGPEYLLIDPARGRAYMNTWKDESLAVDLKERKIVARWKNGCQGSRGLALDEKRGYLMVGCDEGKASVLAVDKDGALLSTLSEGAGVDIIAYNPVLRHLYLPGADSATMAVIDVSDAGKLSLVKSLPTAKGAHCAVADPRGGAWVCDPAHGRILHLSDAAGGTD